MDDADLVAHVYTLWNENGLEAALPFFADDIELTDPPQMPDGGAWRGLDAVRARLEEVAAALGRENVELIGVEQVGDTLLVSLAWHAGAGDGSSVLGDVFHLVEAGEGRIKRIRVFLHEDEARGAGVSG